MSIRDERKQQSRQALLDAALKLSTSGRSFSTISLREIAREVGLVPTAFYRHFEDMDQLGCNLVEQVSLRLREVILQLRQGYFIQQNAKTRSSIELFFKAVDESPQDWLFFIAERWGGSLAVRQEIANEIDILIAGLGNDLTESTSFKHVESAEDLMVISTILINLSFTWAMTWRNMRKNLSSPQLETEQQQYIDQVTVQVRLLFRGIENWQSAE